jgi:hypothetical protein
MWDYQQVIVEPVLCCGFYLQLYLDVSMKTTQDKQM